MRSPEFLLILLLASGAQAQSVPPHGSRRGAAPADVHVPELLPAPSPTVRGFESLAELAPRPAEEAYALSVRHEYLPAFFVIDGWVELPPDEWFRGYTPIVSPTGELQHLRTLPSSGDSGW
jgi:hypothetical protein